MSEEDRDLAAEFDVEEWADVSPLPQDDGPAPLCAIAYPADYARAMDIFRRVSLLQEVSQRALRLTTYIIGCNPAHYTIWHYRKRLLLALKKPLLDEEMIFLEVLAEEHPKSYQIWHHRQWIIEESTTAKTALTFDAAAEIDFVNRMLLIDAKNYHAWSYRQWVVKRFGLWADEFRDIDALLQEDFRNNSAWNQRYFVYSERGVAFTEEDLAFELEYTITKIKMAPRNESPWNYLRGILKLAGKKPHEVSHVVVLLETFYASFQKEQQDEEATSAATHPSSLHQQSSSSSLEQQQSLQLPSSSRFTHALSMLVDTYLIQRQDKSQDDQQQTLSDKINKIYNHLIQIDRIRANYWRFMQKSI